jgi:hypothetical protein
MYKRPALGIAVLLLVGCAGSPSSSTSSPSPETSKPTEPLTLVALADSWAEGAHCGYCETFAGRYADFIRM